ncbi:MAG: helix-turn-helix domain-containing protein [Formivibrio sp.]|nr:helix-turn-helix domain-containing protein [Formivibrio sp.]
MSLRPKPASQPPLPYDCPLEHVLGLLAGAWTVQILWFLRAEPRRFGDLRRDLKKVSTKVLTNRLRVMEEHGLLIRTILPSNPPQVEYSLTPLSRELEAILDCMEQVARRLACKPPQALDLETQKEHSRA